MNEVTLQWIAFLKIIFVAFYALLYGFGGMKGKWKRRLLGPLLITTGIVGFSLWQSNFSWWYILCALLYFGATSLGYGADRLSIKILKRGYCGLAYACASLPIAIVNSAWILWALHTALCLIVSITMGAFNPTEARGEETIIGFTSAYMPMYMF